MAHHKNFGRKELALLITLAAVAIDFLGVSIVVPVLPFYALAFDATADELGYMFAAFAAAAMLSTLWMSGFSDKFGRKPTFMLSFIGSMAGFILQGLAWDVPSLIVFRFVAGLFGGTAPVAMAYITDVCTPAERPRWLASVGATIAGTFLFGPAVGAGLAEFSLNTPFFVSAAFSFAGLLVAIKFLHEPSDLLTDQEAKHIDRMQRRQERLDAEAEAAAAAAAAAAEDDDDAHPPAEAGAHTNPVSTTSDAEADAGGAIGDATAGVVVQVPPDGDSDGDAKADDTDAAAAGGDDDDAAAAGDEADETKADADADGDEGLRERRRRNSSVLEDMNRTGAVKASRTQSVDDEAKPAPEKKTNQLLVYLAASVNFTNTMAFTGLQILAPLLMKDVFGFGSLELGFIFMSTSVVLIFTQTVEFNKLQKKLGLLDCATVGSAIHALGHFLMPVWKADAGYGRTAALVFQILSLCVLVNGMALVTPSMSSFLAAQATKKNAARTLAKGQFASGVARMIGPLVLTPAYSVSATAGFAVSGGCAVVQIFLLLFIRFACVKKTATRLVLASKPELATTSDDVYLNELRDYIKQILEERNYSLRYAGARSAVTELVDQAIPFLHADGQERLADINAVVTSLGHPSIVKVVPEYT